MKVRPILFSAEMVRALLEGRKKQTRRIVKPQPPAGWELESRSPEGHRVLFAHGYETQVFICPYGKPGDLLWVRETWGWSPFASMPPSPAHKQFVVYAADDPTVGYEFKARPSIHMPRWASRLTLKITEVRVQRVQEISEEDAAAEGAPMPMAPREH